MKILKTLGKIISMSMKGYSLRDKWCALLLAGFPMIGLYRKGLRSWWFNRLNALCVRGQLMVSVTLSGRRVVFFMREENEGDYLVGGELVAQVYVKPSFVPTQIVDGGANIGMFAVVANAYFPEAPIVCYEPEPDNFQQLTRNLMANNINYKAIKKGLWSREANLYFHKQSSQIGFLDENYSDMPVSCTLPAIGENSWVKLDIEGAEYEVLPALMIGAIRPMAITMEVHHALTKGTSIIDMLDNAGYLVTGDRYSMEDCFVIEAIQVS